MDLIRTLTFATMLSCLSVPVRTERRDASRDNRERISFVTLLDQLLPNDAEDAE